MPSPAQFLLIVSLAAPFGAVAQTVELTAPRQVSAGSELQVGFSGETQPLDFISIDDKGAAEGDYGHYQYAKKGSPVTLRAPDVPGDYEIRYHVADSPYGVIASLPLTVEDVEANVEAPAEVDAGTSFEVRFTGPNGKMDFISIDAADAAERDYGPYVYTAKGSPVQLRAPDEGGAYLVRYHLGQTYRVVGQAPVAVRATAATIEAPAAVTAGSEVEIAWSGPNGAQDFISIDAVGAAERDYGAYSYTSTGSPVTIRAPEDSGDYLIRYHTGQTYRVIGQQPLRVDAATASLDGPAEVEARSVFEVGWSGPDNPEDYVSIASPDAQPNRQVSYAYTRRGSPARLEAPKEAGSYELRYVTGQKNHILARAPITVTPGKVPGTLRVTAGDDSGAAFGAVELILDASGSMLQKLGGERRIDLAKAALVELVNQTIPAGAPFALRVFGHRQPNACRTDLEIPLAPLERGAAAATIGAIEAKNLAKTPIGASLRMVEEDLAGVEGAAVVVLVTDGEETCDGDPAAAIEALRQAGFDVRVNIVGFAIDELALQEEFARWAEIGRGGYFDAGDGAALAEAMRASLRLPYEVEQAGQVVATGVVNGNAIELLPGTYQLEILSTPPQRIEVTIEPEKETVAVLQD